MSALLQEQVAIVTGAGSGIGQGIATRFAEEGAAIVVNDLDPVRAASTVELINAAGGRAVACAGDVSDRDVADRLLACALEDLGGCDSLVNNAGILTRVPLLELTDEDWDRVIRVNLRSTFLCTQVVARHWRTEGRPGRIVNISSSQAVMASRAGLAHYGASKAAIAQFTRVAAAELAEHGINVNAIGPGTVPTMIGGNPAPTGAPDMDMWRKLVPIGRPGTPRDVANLAVFMCSDQADYLTGQLVLLDGGRNLLPGELPGRRG